MTVSRQKYNWADITTQFMASEFDDLGTFLRQAGWSQSLTRHKEARGLGDKKRKVIEGLRQRLTENILTEPLRQREEKKFKVLSDLEKAAMALKTVALSRLHEDMAIRQMKSNERPEEWLARMKLPEVKDYMLGAGDLIACTGAIKVADDLIRKATGLEEYDWEKEERNSKLLQSARKMEWEVVQTSNARPLDQLPHAPEDEKKQA